MSHRKKPGSPARRRRWWSVGRRPPPDEEAVGPEVAGVPPTETLSPPESEGPVEEAHEEEVEAVEEAEDPLHDHETEPEPHARRSAHDRRDRDYRKKALERLGKQLEQAVERVEFADREDKSGDPSNDQNAGDG